MIKRERVSNSDVLTPNLQRTPILFTILILTFVCDMTRNSRRIVPGAPTMARPLPSWVILSTDLPHRRSFLAHPCRKFVHERRPVRTLVGTVLHGRCPGCDVHLQQPTNQPSDDRARDSGRTVAPMPSVVVFPTSNPPHPPDGWEQLHHGVL